MGPGSRKKLGPYPTAMKFAKRLFILSASIFMLLRFISPAMSRDEVPKQRSETSEERSRVNPTDRDKALEGMIILYGTRENARTSVPSPRLQKRSRSNNYLETEHSQFSVTYTGFTDEARVAFQYAVDIWNSLIRSPVPIWIDATFTDFGGYEDGEIVLGGAQPVAWKPSRALNLWFVDALADQKAGRDLADGEPDIITRFNSHTDVNWYFGTDGNTPAGKTDFVSTVVHEIAHGLGFFSAARTENVSIRTFSASGERGKLRSGKPDELAHIYDFFVVNGSGEAITTFRDPSTNLLDQFTSNNLFWSGAKGIAANGGGHPQLHAPSTWDEGSGYAHLDETLFPPGDVNSLMTPYLATQEAIHDPGPIALGMLEDMGWSINKAPVFAEGSVTTRTVAEKTGAGVSIGNPVVATDANNEPLTYQLRGIDAASFDIDSTSGQLKTKAELHHETKTSYTVIVTVSDGRLVDEIIVIITIIDVAIDPATNSVPRFIDRNPTTRTVAENTARGVDIGSPITAIDAEGDSLTYTLSGIDAASFDLDTTSGQLKTRAALDYETKHTYTVKVTVSDGNLTDSITVTIKITDMDDQESPVIMLTSQPLMETTLNGGRVALTLRNRVYENWIGDSVTVTGIAGVIVRPFNVDRVNDTTLSVQLTFDGTDLDTNATLTFTVKAEAIVNYEGPTLTATVPVTAVNESVKASSAAPLTEATLNRSMVTLTLSGRYYESRHTVGNNVTVSGITGVTVSRFDIERISDTQVNIKLIFDGTDFDANATLTFRIGSDAIIGYNGTALVTQLPVIAVVERMPTITAFAPRPLTEATLNESVVTLTLSSGVYAKSIANIRRALQVSGIPGVTFRQSDVRRLSDTQVTVKLVFDGTNFDTDATLTFRIEAGAIVAYNGPARISEIPVTALVEGRPTITPLIPQSLTEATLDGSVILLVLNNATYTQSRANIRNAVTISGIKGVTVKKSGIERLNDTRITVELEFDGNFDAGAILTVTVEADAIAGYDGPARIAGVVVGGSKESVVASTDVPLTETTLNGSVVTLTLNGATYERSNYDIRNAVKVSGVKDVTFHWFDLNRISDTELKVELTFDGNFDADATLTFAVEADAIAGYDGPDLNAQVTVTAEQESVVASTEAPLTEATLKGSVVTLTLSGRTYERSIFKIRDAVKVSGIAGVTLPWHGFNRKSDTELTVELDFNGNIDTDSTLTFTVGSEAVLRYAGPAFIPQVAVTGSEKSMTATVESPLTEAVLDGSVVTLTLKGTQYESAPWKIRDAVKVSGIAGVTLPWHGFNRKSDTELTVELDFNGNFDTDSALTFTVEADAITDYDGPALTAQITVTADRADALLVNFPNPFNPETWVPYQLAKPAEVTITIYAVDGQVVRTLALGHQTAGVYQSRSRAAYWDGRNAFGEPVASGVYFYTLTAGDFTATRKMLIRK